MNTVVRIKMSLAILMIGAFLFGHALVVFAQDEVNACQAGQPGEGGGVLIGLVDGRCLEAAPEAWASHEGAELELADPLLGWPEAQRMVSEYRQTTGWDWRMPTLQELEALFEARAKVPGLRMPAYYWSSTQSSDGQLMLLEMFSGHIEPSREDDSQALRPVREVTEGWQPVDGGA